MLSYFSLARHLDACQPFYTVRAPELDGGREPYDRIEDMAACYVEAIQKIQPEGPYLLGGWSLGGVIAFELARQFQEQGERVAIVALLNLIPGPSKPVVPAGLSLVSEEPARRHRGGLRPWPAGIRAEPRPVL